MKKKIICSILISSLLTLSLVGCGKNKDKSTEQGLTEIQTTEATTEGEGYVPPEPNKPATNTDAEEEDIAFDLNAEYIYSDLGFYSFLYPTLLNTVDRAYYADTSAYIVYEAVVPQIYDTISMYRYTNKTVEEIVQIVEDANKDNEQVIMWVDEEVQEGKMLKHTAYKKSDGFYTHVYIDYSRNDNCNSRTNRIYTY